MHPNRVKGVKIAMLCSPQLLETLRDWWRVGGNGHAVRTTADVVESATRRSRFCNALQKRDLRVADSTTSAVVLTAWPFPPTRHQSRKVSSSWGEHNIAIFTPFTLFGCMLQFEALTKRRG